MNDNWVKPQTLEETKKFNGIVDFARTIRERFEPTDNLRKDIPQIRKKIIAICRQCKDPNCPENCEVKKAFRAVIKLS